MSPPTSPLAAVAPTSICLTCRTALPHGVPCDGGRHHRVADLKTAAGRQAHLAEVWGPASRQRRLREILRAGATGSGVGAVLQLLDCAAIGDALPLAVLAGMVLFGLLFVVIRYLVGKVTDVRRRHRLLRPYGALDRPRLPGSHDATIGVAEGTPQPSPLHGEPCLAFGIVLRTTGPGGLHGDILWREASTGGFTVRLDGGALVRIPAGRVRLVESSRGARRASRDKAAVRLPAGMGVEIEGELSELPFDHADEQTIRPNDRVAILSSVELCEDRDSLPASPRTPAHLALVAVGVPVLK